MSPILSGLGAVLAVLSIVPLPVHGATHFSPRDAPIIENISVGNTQQRTPLMEWKRDFTIIAPRNHGRQLSEILFGPLTRLPGSDFIRVGDKEIANILSRTVAMINYSDDPSRTVLPAGSLDHGTEIGTLDAGDVSHSARGIARRSRGKDDRIGTEPSYDGADDQVERIQSNRGQRDLVADTHLLRIGPLGTQIGVVLVLGIIAIGLIFAGLWLTLQVPKRLRERGWMMFGLGLGLYACSLVVLGA